MLDLQELSELDKVEIATDCYCRNLVGRLEEQSFVVVVVGSFEGID